MVNHWDQEYARSGMPSSYRDDPSGVVVWMLDNWPHLTGSKVPRRGLDVGCGTARNTVYLARHGVRMSGFDASEVAIKAGRERAQSASVDISLEVRDLTDGLPAGDGELDVVLDVFVYKHQLAHETRRSYRRELRRILAPDGRVLMSLAEPSDGYYSSCPAWGEKGTGPHAILDPVVAVGSALFSLEELRAEMADEFVLEMAWRKEKIGVMHGNKYLRHTLATVWRLPRSESTTP
jgi:SAM-dependent methyltransferase